MRVDFYVPCTVAGYNDRFNKYIEYNGTLSTLVDEIERQLSVDFCEDFAEFVVDDDEVGKLGYKVYSGCINMTVYNEKLYIRVSAFITFPQYHESVPLHDGKTITLNYDETRDFKQFIDHCIAKIDGQMSDGWGEGFEQRKLKLTEDPNENFHPCPGSVEFVRWDGFAVDNRGKMMYPITYNKKSKLFNHGWIMSGWVGPNSLVGLLCQNANLYNSLMTVKWTKREYKKAMRQITNVKYWHTYIDRVFIDKFINWYINHMKAVGVGDKETKRRLRAYQKLFK